MGSFLSSIFGGSNPTLDHTINTAGSLEGFSQGTGETGTTDALKFYHSILSGDPTQDASALAPEIAGNQESIQQQKGQIGQFGTRSGGTGATVAGLDSTGAGNVLKLLGGLKSGAAAGEAGIGQSNLAQAAVTNKQQADLSQEALQNMMNSILGKGISAGIGGLESFGLGKL